jgi:3-oxocholest-4-en-26-oyl-CoA dehydrogenase alpha subunit
VFIAYTPEQERLRGELREYFAGLMTPERRAALASGGDYGDGGTYREVVRQMGTDGWLTLSWPTQYGGRGASMLEQLIFTDEAAAAGAPVPFLTINTVGPTIMRFGTEAQKEFFLPRIASGDLHFAIGYSEPGAGTDLASLRTRAVRDGNEWVINGQKMWTSLIQYADYVWLACRTDPDAPKHKGISTLLVDMKTPGVEVRPLRTMAGDLTFSELFFTDVAVPRANLLGNLNEGWKVAMTTLSYERAGVARLHLSLRDRLNRLMDDAKGLPAMSDPVIRDRLMAIYARIATMGWTTTRELQAIGAGRQPSAMMGSIAKLMWSLIEQALADLAVDVMGLEGLGGRWGKNLASSRQSTIAGGTTEINRNILAEHGLGLPR